MANVKRTIHPTFLFIAFNFVGVNGDIFTGSANVPTVLNPGPYLPPSEDQHPEDPQIALCPENYVTHCIDKLSYFTRIMDLPFPETHSDLNELCFEAITGYLCSSTSMTNKACGPAEQKNLLPLYSSISETLFTRLCDVATKDPFKAALLDNSECIQENIDKLKVCADYSDVPSIPFLSVLDNTTEDVNIKASLVCDTINCYRKCANNIIVHSCGKQAARTFTDYVLLATGQEVVGFCNRVNHTLDEQSFENCPDSSTCLNPTILLMLISVFLLRL